VLPDPTLTESLRKALGERARPATVASFDSAPPAEPLGEGIDAADMQTVAILARAGALGVEAAAVLVAIETAAGGALDEDERADAERRAGQAASDALSASG
jgi:hypothetical protein